MASVPVNTHTNAFGNAMLEKASMDVQQTPASNYYRPELDALRFLAFLAVFFYHGVQINVHQGLLRYHQGLTQSLVLLHRIGAFGLSLFFFLSSFLITTLLILEKERTGTVAFRSFYVRRVLRIWPLYLTYVGLAFALGQVWPAAHFSSHALLSFYAMSANWYVLAYGMMGPLVSFLWSISIEEQFYLIWPTLMRKLQPGRVRTFCLALLLAGMAYTGVLGAMGTDFGHLWFNSGVELVFFAAGGLMATYFGLRRQRASMRRSMAALSLAAASWVGADLFMGVDTESMASAGLRAVPAYTLIVLGAASLLWAFLHMPRNLIRPELVYLGRISYGLYVFHGFTLLICERILGPRLHAHLWLLPTFLLTVLLASISYEFLEKPFLRLKHHFEVVHSRTA